MFLRACEMNILHLLIMSKPVAEPSRGTVWTTKAEKLLRHGDRPSPTLLGSCGKLSAICLIFPCNSFNAQGKLLGDSFKKHALNVVM